MGTETSLVKNNLVQRLIAGISGAALTIFLLTYSIYTFYIVCTILTVTLLLEFYSLTENYKPKKWLGILVGSSLLVSIGLIQNNVVDYRMFVFVVLAFMSIPISILFDKNSNAIHSLSSTLMGLVYIITPLALMMLMSQNNEEEYNRFLILGIFLIIWSNDTGAYFTGKSLGKTKLFERISPNKTVEGSAGGIVLAFVIITIYFHYIVTTDKFSFIFWLIFTAVISVAGILGDLIESQFKRTLNIKDSGALIPGHGGFLDRFDALIFALPFAYACYLFT